MTSTSDIVAKLWSLCHVLRDDGITYHEYVTELTWLLFLKMEKEQRDAAREKDERKRLTLPKGYQWEDLEALDGIDLLNTYRALLLHLGSSSNARVQAIFANAST